MLEFNNTLRRNASKEISSKLKFQKISLLVSSSPDDVSIYYCKILIEATKKYIRLKIKLFAFIIIHYDTIL